jgi:hypothetical protein
MLNYLARFLDPPDQLIDSPLGVLYVFRIFSCLKIYLGNKNPLQMNHFALFFTAFIMFTTTYSQQLFNASSSSNLQFKSFSQTRMEPHQKIPSNTKSTLFKSRRTDDKIYIDFVGAGDIQKSFSQGDQINANTGLGIIFERYAGPEKVVQSLEMEAVINIATTADTITAEMDATKGYTNQSDFGTYILNPVSAKQSLYLNSNVYFGFLDSSTNKSWTDLNSFAKFSSIVSGLNFRVISSNNTWVYQDTASNLGAISLRMGIFHEFIPDNYRLTKEEKRSKYSFVFGVNYSFRGIIGDITSEKNNDLRKKILGTGQTSFNGLEFNLGFRLNNLRAEFQMPILKPRDGSVDGLTNTQFIFSIKFVGGFPLKIESNTGQNNDEKKQ